MAERRKASSTLDDHWSTARRKGMSPRGERIFNVASSIVILFFAIGWSWSIALARGSITTRPATQTTGILASALTESDAPSMAYLTDASLRVVYPLRGDSRTLLARIENSGHH